MEATQPERSAVATWLMRVNLGCGLVSGIALLLMMVVGAVDVVGTNLDMIGLTSVPLPAAFEFMATMMVVNVFLAMSLGQSRRAHIRVEVLVNLLPRGGRRTADVIQYLFAMILFALIAWFGWSGALHSLSVGEYEPGIINYPVWPARLVLAFGATLMAAQCLFDLLGVFRPRLRTDEDVHPAPPIS